MKKVTSPPIHPQREGKDIRGALHDMNMYNPDTSHTNASLDPSNSHEGYAKNPNGVYPAFRAVGTIHPSPNTQRIARSYKKSVRVGEEMLLQMGNTLVGAADDCFGWSVSLSSNGRTIAIGTPHNDDNGNASGKVSIHTYSSSANEWTTLGSPMKGAARDLFGFSVSLSSDGRTVAIGASNSYDNGERSGHVTIYSYASSTDEWTKLGNTLAGAAGDGFGTSVSLSSDSRTVAIGGTQRLNGSRGYVRIYSYSSSADEWTTLGSPIAGAATGDEFGYSVSLSSDGRTVAVGGAQQAKGGRGYVRIYSYSLSTGEWTKLGQTIIGTGARDQFGFSVSLSSDGRTVAVGAVQQHGGRGNVRIHSYSSSAGKWTTLGFSIVGAAEGDQFGRSVSLSSDGRTVAVGAVGNDDNGPWSGHVRIYSYSLSLGEWTTLGSPMVGAAEGDRFGYYVSLSSDGRTVAIGAKYNDDNGGNSGHVRVYSNQNFILARDTGYCIDKYENRPVEGKVLLSKDSFGPSLEKQLICKELCIKHMKQHPDSYFGCQAVWGQFSSNGCYITTEPVVRGDNAHPFPCWIIINELNFPFKQRELGLCQTINDKATNDSKFKSNLGQHDNHGACFSQCQQEYKTKTTSNAISGCEYDEKLKTCYIYNNSDWKVVRGNYGENLDENFKCWIRGNFCTNDAECDDGNHCTIDICDSANQCVNKLSFNHCRTFGEPKTLAIRVKAKDAETTKSVDEMKSMIFDSTKASYSVQSQLNLCSHQRFKPIAYERAIIGNEI